MRRTIRAAAFALLLPATGVAAAPAVAQSDGDRGAESLAAEGIEKLMKALELFVGSLPIYEPPEILPNGDIIIRRVQPDGGPPVQDGEKDGGVTDT